MKTDLKIIEDLARDAKRYRRLQILGAAPGGSKQLDNGTVLCFTNLDAFVDDDLRFHASRGEAFPVELEQSLAALSDVETAPQPVAFSDTTTSGGSAATVTGAMAMGETVQGTEVFSLAASSDASRHQTTESLLEVLKAVTASLGTVVVDLESLRTPHKRLLRSSIYVLKNLKNALAAALEETSQILAAASAGPRQETAETPAREYGGHLESCWWNNIKKRYECADGCEIARLNALASASAGPTPADESQDDEPFWQCVCATVNRVSRGRCFNCGAYRAAIPSETPTPADVLWLLDGARCWLESHHKANDPFAECDHPSCRRWRSIEAALRARPSDERQKETR